MSREYNMKLEKTIEKIYDDTLETQDVYDYIFNVIEWTKQCEENNKISDIGRDVHVISCKVKKEKDKNEN